MERTQKAATVAAPVHAAKQGAGSVNCQTAMGCFSSSGMLHGIAAAMEAFSAKYLLHKVKVLLAGYTCSRLDWSAACSSTICQHSSWGVCCDHRLSVNNGLARAQQQH
jgi:hypothetical protein